MYYSISQVALVATALLSLASIATARTDEVGLKCGAITAKCQTTAKCSCGMTGHKGTPDCTNSKAPQALLEQCTQHCSCKYDDPPPAYGDHNKDPKIHDFAYGKAKSPSKPKKGKRYAEPEPEPEAEADYEQLTRFLYARDLLMDDPDLW